MSTNWRRMGWGVPTVVAIVAAVICLFTSPVAAGQEDPPAPPAKVEVAALTLETIDQQHKILKERIASVRKQIESFQESESEIAAVLNAYALTLVKLQSAYERLRTALKKQDSLREEKRLLAQKVDEAGPLQLSEPAPYNLSFYDRILSEQETIAQKKDNLALALGLSEGFLGDSRTILEEARRQKRAFTEASESDEKGSIDRAHDLKGPQIEIQVRLGGVLYLIEAANGQNLELQLAIEAVRHKLLETKLEWVGQRLRFDPQDLDQQLETFATHRKELQKRIQALKSGREEAEGRWLAAQQKMSGSDPAGSDTVGQAFVRERDAWRKTYQTVLEQTQSRLRLLAHGEDVWRQRYAIVQGTLTGNPLMEKRQEIEVHRRSLERMLKLERNRQTELQAKILAVENELAAAELDSKVGTHLENQVTALRKLVERRFEYTTALIRGQQLDRRLLDEIEVHLKRRSVPERLTTLRERIGKIWATEVWVIDNQAVTIRKLAVALTILILGIILIHTLLKLVHRRVKRVPHIRETTARNLEKVVTYVAYLLVVLFALQMVKIPLTAFAFLGGAIAIGVGFGAQNLINNFISGFIMMAERPIGIGDLIELDGIVGQVEEIGGRCTRVRTGENIQILVPNSAFLENNIINWTLSDHQIRSHVSVGVVYGSQVGQVQEKLLRAVADHPRILKSPAPFVLFENFGDNALNFEVHFWISVRRVLERRMIESEIRFGIEALFKKAGIVIAFPQRDLHLDTTSPLELRLLDDPSKPSSTP